MFIEGQVFSSWFGGSDDTWSPPYDTYTMIRNVKGYRYDPVVSSATVSSTDTTTNIRPGTGTHTGGTEPGFGSLPFAASAANQLTRREVIREGN